MLSIIIPTRNRLSSLERCVYLIKKHTSIPFELIICNSNSTEDGYLEYLNKTNSTVISTNLDIPLSYSQNLNLGLKIAKGDFLTIPGIANDIEVTKNWVEPIIKMMSKDKNIGMGVPGVTERNGLTVYGGFMNPENYNLSVDIEPDYAGYGIVSRETFEKVGLLDENYKPIYLEDADYGMRIKECGYKIKPCKESLIIHNHEFTERVPINENNRIYFNRKWGI